MVGARGVLFLELPSLPDISVVTVDVLPTNNKESFNDIKDALSLKTSDVTSQLFTVSEPTFLTSVKGFVKEPWVRLDTTSVGGGCGHG